MAESRIGGPYVTVDVEEWFHAPGHVYGDDPTLWDRLPPTLPHALESSLDLLAGLRVQGTFFILGWIASRHPRLVRRVAECGHEVACHGWFHRRVDRTGRQAFQEEIARSKGALEEASGRAVCGFRAPRWSIGPCAWAYEALGAAGFRYSSSRLCIPGLGAGDSTPSVHSGVHEYPALSSRVLGIPVPAGGTVVLRTFPLRWLRAAKKRREARGFPAVYWFHPWELVADAPRLEGSALFRWSRYARLEALPGRLSALLEPGDCRLVRLVAASG